MSLDKWRDLNVVTANIGAYLLFAVCLYTIYCFRSLNRQFRLIAYYVFISSILEFIAKVVTENKDQDALVNLFYVFFEAVFVGLFLYTNLSSLRIKRIIFVGMILVLMFQIYLFLTFPFVNSEYGSAFLASIYSFLILFSLFDQSQNTRNGLFFKRPTVLMMLNFLIAYLIVLILFWFLPITIEYSRVLANVLLILKNIVGVVFYLVLTYIMKKTTVVSKIKL